MKRVAIFASGSGSNAQNLIHYYHVCHPEKDVKISLIVANRPDAYVLERARLLNVPALVFSREEFYPQIELPIAEVSDTKSPVAESPVTESPVTELPVAELPIAELPYPLLNALSAHKIDYIILAGFLWLIPQYLIDAFPGRIVNIHPALLPAYGGKGMYGMNVHRAVVANGEAESGITIHLVDNQYDHGSPLFQARCRVDVGETPESLSEKIHLLEQEHFPKVIDKWINGSSGKSAV